MPDPPRHQRRRHPAEEPDAQPRLRQRPEQADPGAEERGDQPRLGHLRVPGGRHVQDDRGGAGRALPGVRRRRARPARRRQSATGCSRCTAKLYFALGRTDAAPAALGDVLPDAAPRSPRQRGSREPAAAHCASEVLDANLELVRAGLVIHAFGNASGIDRDEGLVVIKPSGVPYDGADAEEPGRHRPRGPRGGGRVPPLVGPADAPRALQGVRRRSAASCTPTRATPRPGRRPAARFPASARRTRTTSAARSR